MLTINKVLKNKKTIRVLFSCDEKWKKYINEFSIENTFDVEIEKIPDSIAVIPALCSLLPIAWVFNLEIKCEELDKVFYESIPNIKNGYKKMYPSINFDGRVIVNNIITNNYDAEKAGVLFSGGVDATTTVLRHLNEKPDIITIFGADIKLSDKTGIENVNRSNIKFSKLYDLDYQKIFSSFKLFLNEERLQHEVKLIDPSYGWWHDFHHGIGLIGLVAPLSYIKGYSKIYIASSFHKSQWGQYTCASDPVIDNNLKYGKTITIHDGYELTRTDKIRFINEHAKESNKKPYLRVCWESSGGKNCCDCEKCRRTYLALLAEGANPNEFGLAFTKKQYSRMVSWCKRHLPYQFGKTAVFRYEPIKQSFINNYSIEEMPKGLAWIREVEIAHKRYPVYRKLEDKIRRRLGIY